MAFGTCPQPPLLYFVTCHDKRLTGGPENSIFSQPNRKGWEVWSIEPTNDGRIGTFTIRAEEHGHFVGSNEEGDLTGVSHSEEWAILSSPHGGFFLQSLKHEGKRVSCDGDHVYLDDQMGGWETWNLEPILPHTLTETQIWSWVGIGIATLLSAIATPFAVVGVVGAIGFGSGGITVGSVAAGMMSAEAVASGGAIAAGGTVATLQSIGAVGLSAGATAAAVGGGAAVDSVASTGIAAAKKGLEGPQANANADVPTDKLSVLVTPMSTPMGVLPSLFSHNSVARQK